jgi:uracil-DNA glycosylase
VAIRPWPPAVGRRYQRSSTSSCSWSEAQATVFPPDEDVFAALRLTPPDQVRAVILGQDPYYRPGQASGLAFSVRAGVDRPRSLVNIIKELETDLGHPVPAEATLEPWARHGVLLLNTALTVREGLPNSHRRQWKAFTAAIVAMLAERPVPLAFLLWGEPAKAAGQKIDRTRHIVVKSAHPSPLSAKGFIGSASVPQDQCGAGEEGAGAD